MRDGSDAVSDWPLLNALLTSGSGADLVAIHGGGGGYAGYYQSAGVTVVAYGSAVAADRIAAVLTCGHRDRHHALRGRGISRRRRSGQEQR